MFDWVLCLVRLCRGTAPAPEAGRQPPTRSQYVRARGMQARSVRQRVGDDGPKTGHAAPGSHSSVNRAAQTGCMMKPVRISPGWFAAMSQKWKWDRSGAGWRSQVRDAPVGPGRSCGSPPGHWRASNRAATAAVRRAEKGRVVANGLFGWARDRRWRAG